MRALGVPKEAKQLGVLKHDAQHEGEEVTLLFDEGLFFIIILSRLTLTFFRHLHQEWSCLALSHVHFLTLYHHFDHIGPPIEYGEYHRVPAQGILVLHDRGYRDVLWDPLHELLERLLVLIIVESIHEMQLA